MTYITDLRLKFGFYFSKIAEVGIVSHKLFVANPRVFICSDRCNSLFESNVEYVLQCRLRFDALFT